MFEKIKKKRMHKNILKNLANDGYGIYEIQYIIQTGKKFPASNKKQRS